MNTARCAERVCKDTELLVQDTNELLKAAGQDLRAKASDAKECLTEALETAKGECLQAQRHVRRLADQAGDLAHERPYPAIGIAFALGLLGALLIRRR